MEQFDAVKEHCAEVMQCLASAPGNFEYYILTITEMVCLDHLFHNKVM